MTVSTIQGFSNLLAIGTTQASATAANLRTALAATTLTGPGTGAIPAGKPLPSGYFPTTIQGYRLTNNDATNTVYVDHTNAASATVFSYSIPPGGFQLITGDVGLFDSLWIASGAGTANLRVALLG